MARKYVRKSDKDKLEFNKIPYYGDLITLKEFREHCKAGMFIDYDGFGYLATQSGMSDMVIRPSYLGKIVIPKWATHVVWFNR